MGTIIREFWRFWGGVSLASYIGGLAIEHKKSRSIYLLFIALEVLGLSFFKYTDFVLQNLNKVFPDVQSGGWNYDVVVLPIGLSFIVFQACTYLSDVYTERIKAEKNFIRFAAFCAFFPTLLSGPIQKARSLLPQIASPKEFDFDEARKGTLLFVWGAFEKLMVANRLSAVYIPILKYYQNYSSAWLLTAALSFSLYIYADFSSYSDMARGIAKIIGIDVGINFKNPYMSKSTSEFWSRWHISLYEWFKEIVYIPLGGSRKGTFRKYFNIMLVFTLSGLWHGAQWHFVLWGMVNGLVVIAGRIVRRLKSALYHKMCVDEEVESIVWLKRTVVFALITTTWVFFVCGIRESIWIIKRIVLFDFISIFDPELLNVSGSAVGTIITLAMVMIFIKGQIKRQNEAEIYAIYKKQPLIMQCLPIAVLICICIFGACATDASVNTQFLYFNF